MAQSRMDRMLCLFPLVPAVGPLSWSHMVLSARITRWLADIAGLIVRGKLAGMVRKAGMPRMADAILFGLEALHEDDFPHGPQ